MVKTLCWYAVGERQLPNMNMLAAAGKQAPVIECCQWLLVSPVADGLLIPPGSLLVKV